MDDQLGKEDKNKRVNSKSQAFIWRTDNKEMVVGLLMDHELLCETGLL